MDTDTKLLTDSGLLSLATGFLLPPFVAIVQQPRWADWLRATMTAVICVVVGYLEARLSGTLDTRDILRGVLLILIAANSTYRGFWKPIGVAETIEHVTNLQPISGAISGFFADRAKKSEEDQMIVAQTARDRADVLARAKATIADQNEHRAADAAHTVGKPGSPSVGKLVSPSVMPSVVPSVIPTMPGLEKPDATEGAIRWHNPTNLS